MLTLILLYISPSEYNCFFIIKCRQYGQRGKVLKDKGLFLVVQSDYHLQVRLTESISWFCSMMTLSFFKQNGKSPSSPVMGFFWGLMARQILYFCQTFTAFFMLLLHVTFQMASPLKSKVNKFPHGIINQSIIGTITRLETFSQLQQTGRPGVGGTPVGKVYKSVEQN